MGNITDPTFSIEQWFQDGVPESVQLGGGIGELENLISAQRGRPSIIPPDRLSYFRKLKASLLQGRVITSYYNHVLLGLLALFTLLNFLEKRRCRKRCQKRASEAAKGNTGDKARNSADSSPSPSGASSSTSSPLLITTPSGAIKDSELDIERLPLLGFRRASNIPPKGLFIRLQARVTAWLEYQPRPLPLINRVLPSNSVSLVVFLWLCINLCFQFYKLPLALEYSLVFATRAGDMFIVNLPLLYLLAAKNQPIKLLTGRSYESLVIFHRRVGEWMCLEALVHSVAELLARFAFVPDWLPIHIDVWKYLSHPVIYFGICAFTSYELLYFTSLGSFRQRWYEVFLASHVVPQILALGFLYLHYHTARPYVMLSLAIFIVDRLVWRLGMKSAAVEADVRVLADGSTIVLSAEWQHTVGRSRWILWPRQNIKYGWNPTDHVFLSVPTLGRKHALQAHPFTISSAAPPRESTSTGDDSEELTHLQNMKLSLLIRVYDGFTADLLYYALCHRKVAVRLDGPYGSSHALEMLLAADNSVLVAGGSGIAVTLPLAWALLRDKHQQGRGHQVVRLLWVIHSEEHRHWVPRHELDELVAAGLDLVIPRPTSEAGRPDLARQMEDWIGEDSIHGHHEGQTAVVVSGPDGLNRAVRNTCAAAIGRGLDVRLAVEKFGW